MRHYIVRGDKRCEVFSLFVKFVDGKVAGDSVHKLYLLERERLLLFCRTLIGAIPMVTRAQSAANWRSTHTDMDRTHPLTHFTSTQVQPRGTKRQLSYYFSAHAGSFRVSVIHRTVTRTTGSLTCVRRDHACACVYTRGLVTLTASEHNIFLQKKKPHKFFDTNLHHLEPLICSNPNVTPADLPLSTSCG